MVALRDKEEQIEKFLQNNCTTEEAKAFLDWVTTPEGRKSIEKRLDEDILLLLDGNEFLIDHPVRSVFIYQQIRNKIYTTARSGLRIFQITHNWQKIAVTILIPLLIANITLWYIFVKQDIEISWKEVYVPKGEKLQVMFQDGTKVWLNSDSRLRYPVEFTGDYRQVILEGEAYFVVAKNHEMPFLVQTKDIDVKVTGTSFNIRAYKNEKNVTTTLDEGSISLSVKRKNTLQKTKEDEYLLSPGQQASIILEDSSKKISIAPTSGLNSSWKENKLVFKDTPLKDVVQALERWYNVKILVTDTIISKYKYTISFQNEPIQNVLFGLERITPIQCNLKSPEIVEIRKKLTTNNKFK